MSHPSEEDVSSRIMTALFSARGALRAIPRREVLEAVNLSLARVGIDAVDDRRLRDIYSRLPVCAGDTGLFLPVVWDEVRQFQAYLMSKIPAEKAMARIQVICDAFPHLQPHLEPGDAGEQLELPIEPAG